MPRALLASSIVVAILAIFAFWPGYLSQPHETIDKYTHFHAWTAALWLVLLIVQPILVIKRRLHLHRWLGRFSFVLALAFLLAAILLAHFRLSSADASSFAGAAFILYLPISAALLFGTSFALAIWHRKSTPLHSRFMACTGLILVDPVLSRLLAFYVVDFPQYWHYQIFPFGIEIAIVIDLARTIAPNLPSRRVFSVFAIFYASVLLLWFIAPTSGPWLAFAAWFRQLPLT
ncbi:MAG: hypothetical protein ACKVP2_18315 [Burkholderiales bacterium]